MARGRPRPGAAAAASTLAVTCLLAWAGCHVARADIFTRIFVPVCPLQPDPAPSEFLRWSDPQAWERVGDSGGAFRVRSPGTPPGAGAGSDQAGLVPGLGAAQWSNVTVPCGTALLLDVPRVALLHLDVQGLLRVEDSARRTHYTVYASFVTVEGRMAAGTEEQHFQSQLTIELLPNPNARLPLAVPGLAFPDKMNRDQAAADVAQVGHKVFAVVGGQLDFHGMPGGASTPSWVRLARNAQPGDTSITVSGRGASRWPIRGAIALATTSFAPQETEALYIAGFGAVNDSATEILLEAPVQFFHQGDPLGLPPGWEGSVDESAEVGLLSRNIAITAPGEAPPYALEGGHFVVFQTATEQRIEGVEFSGLGQQGLLGRYPLHFHLCGDTGGSWLVRNNAVHDSLQRCVVLHATHNLTIEGTVTYNTSGHCFLLEEGGEQGNTFLGNLGMGTYAPSLGVDPSATDGQPAVFWMTTLGNNFINNTAVGSASSGFWPQLMGPPQGMSASIPELRSLDLRRTVGGLLEGNCAHSNAVFGFQSYPYGVRGTVATPEGSSVTYSTVLDRWRFYKNPIGIMARLTVNLNVTQSVFADNVIGFLADFARSGAVEKSLFVGQTSNRGPLPPCSFCSTANYFQTPPPGLSIPPPPPPPSPGLSVLGIFGVSIQFDDTLYSGNRFSGFVPEDLPSAAFTFGAGSHGPVNTWTTVLMDTQVDPASTAVWFPTYDILPADSGILQTADFVLQDADGSIVGGSGGYIMASSMLPTPTSQLSQATTSSTSSSLVLRRDDSAGGEGDAQCFPLPNSNAHACPGMRLLRVSLEYQEDAYQQRTLPGNYSRVLLTRTADGAQRPLLGNMFSKEPGATRNYFFYAQVGELYEVAIQPPPGDPSWWPPGLFISLVSGSWDSAGPNATSPAPPDPSDAAGAVTLRVLPQDWAQGQGAAPKRWDVQPYRWSFYRPCPGLVDPSPWPVLVADVCKGSWRAAVVRMSPSSYAEPRITLISSSQEALPCTAPPLCGLFPLNYYYYIAPTEDDLHSPPLQPWGYESLNFTDWGRWPIRRTPFQHNNTGGSLTTYIRQPFSVERAHCYTGLTLHHLTSFGLAVFLNGEEAFRYNLPQGQLTGTTPSVTGPSGSPSSDSAVAEVSFASSGLEILSGANHLAFEVHAHCSSCGAIYFDAQVSLHYSC